MYLWLKVIHILAVISWMAGLFYLPRLFVYHADKPVGGESDQTFLVMERRLLKAIMRPALVVVLLSGLGLWHVLALSLSEPWLAVKLVAVAAMVGFHGLLERHVREFREGLRLKPSRYFRIINEIPTLLLIVIVIAVVVRPFS
jgi:protoporphyrinogen IX oxidase